MVISVLFTLLQLTQQTFLVAGSEPLTEICDYLCKVLLQEYLEKMLMVSKGMSRPDYFLSSNLPSSVITRALCLLFFSLEHPSPVISSAYTSRKSFSDLLCLLDAGILNNLYFNFDHIDCNCSFT